MSGGARVLGARAAGRFEQATERTHRAAGLLERFDEVAALQQKE